MNIEWFRDLSICLLGFGATAVIVLIGILTCLLYRKIRPIIDSVKATTKTVENVSSCVEEEVIKPLAQLAAFVQGIRQAINMFGKFSRGKEGGEK
ncbi:hypothetical protein ACFLXG_02310 [Chloroflexota bacterium]